MATRPKSHMTKLTIEHINGKVERLQGHVTKRTFYPSVNGLNSMEIGLTQFETLDVTSPQKTPEQERKELLQKHTEEIGKRLRDLKSLRLAHEQQRERMELQQATAEQNAIHSIKTYAMDAWKGDINGLDLLNALPAGNRHAFDTILNSLKPHVVDTMADIV